MVAPIHVQRPPLNIVQPPLQREGGLQAVEPDPQIRQGRVNDTCCRDMRCVKAMVYLVSAALVAVDVLAFLSSAGIKPSGPKALHDFAEKLGQHDMQNILLMPAFLAVLTSLMVFFNKSCYRAWAYDGDVIQPVRVDEVAVLPVAPVAENPPLVARVEEVELNRLVAPAVLNLDIEERDRFDELVTLV